MAVQTTGIAFPSAYGGGSQSTGGSGGNVYHVTNVLDDSNIGSFRWALAQPRPATIIFDVSGVNMLTNQLVVKDDDLTVAGQTAPLGAYTISAPPTGNINFKMGDFTPLENHIWRYIKIRSQFYSEKSCIELLGGYGTYYDPGNTQPAYARKLIFDHLSFSWSDDEAFNIGGDNSENITVQNTMFAECVKGSLFGDTQGFEIPMSRKNTFRNNVFYNMTHRVPNINGNSVDVYNNVVYDWTFRLSVVTNGTKVNHFNNYYYKGNRTTLGESYNGQPQNFRWRVNGITYKLSIPETVPATELHTNPNTNIKIYSKNNVIQDLYDGTQEVNDKYIWMHHVGYLPDGTYIIPDDAQKFKAGDEMFTNVLFPFNGNVPNVFLTAEESKIVVPNEAGANKSLNGDGTFTIYRDEADQKYRDIIINDTPLPWDATSGISPPPISASVPSAINSQEFINFQASITGVPINTRPVDFYGTNPHIPKAFLTSKGVTNTTTVHNELAPSGYTWLEEYLNGVDIAGYIPAPTITRTDSNPTTIELGGTYIPPTGTWTDETDGTGNALVTGDTVDVNTVGTYNVRLEYTNSESVLGYLDIVYTVQSSGPNTLYPLTESERLKNKINIISLLKKGSF